MLRLAYSLAIGIAVGSAGCSLHFGGDDTGDDCLLAQGDALGAPLPELLNPETLQCEAWGGTACDPLCGPCPPGDQIPPPTWAYCYDACDSLTEADCMAATACRAVFDYGCYTGQGPCSAEVPYLGCHGTDQTGPIEGSCVGLDAQECSRHNDCVALHTPQCSGDGTSCWQQFVECQDEGGMCFAPALCDSVPPTCPPDSYPGVRNGCWTGVCIPAAECEAPPPPCGATDCG